ncbi:major prion protein homolog [Hemicordylus capensis]|uniref:major prion protein homolog n=1 Tax=Hemicordylus capensis TaxID=884348 RepID=UPI002304894C|nr:major prion protein homolog [Hemicordylus capensis]
MGKYLMTSWIAILLILLQSDVSLSKKGKNKPGGGWNTGSQRQPGYPPQNPGYPQNPAYPPRNPGYPQQNPGYPQHNPGYPQRPGYPQNPGYPQRPGYPQNPGYGGGGNWGQYNSKPWKPKPAKPKMKHVAGAAVAGVAAGALGGYLLGSAMSNMNFRFNNHDEERWWHQNRDRYSDQVYYQKYGEPVSRDVFVRDCVNMTVREYIEPTGNQTADEMETKVVTKVVREMCTEQYRLVSGVALLLANPSVLVIITFLLCFLIH